MSRIGQKQPSSVSGHTTLVRETARTVATPTARPPPTVARAGVGVSRLQTGFEAPAQRSVLAKAEAFVTPAPKPRTQAPTTPGQVAPPLPDTELRRALDEAHRLALGNNANGASVDSWMARARELAALNNNDFNAVKYALHSELLGNKPATPTGTGAGPLPDTELRRALEDSHRLVFGSKPTGPNVDTWMARARELAALNNNDFNAVKFALHSELFAASR
jgi:hypothetical protein